MRFIDRVYVPSLSLMDVIVALILGDAANAAQDGLPVNPLIPWLVAFALFRLWNRSIQPWVVKEADVDGEAEPEVK